MLRIHNSLTKTKEPFSPRQPGKVGIYVCGMTVYDLCHLGHARVLVVFDVIVRYLRELGFDVTYVRNITDIDDKIIRRARENGEDVAALTGRYIQSMHEDAAMLGVLAPDREPRATESMGDILAMLQRLMGSGHAYQARNGDIYFDVSRFPGYGRLSGKKLDDLRAGARVEIDEAKDDPLDFVLWKVAKPGEPSWDSPWGPGRPGWHIECSAMSTACLGNHFDIHGGGMDLKFPHHENEIAQSEAATGEKFVDVWIHNGFVQINEEKMSKSLGNFFTVREILDHYIKKYGRKEIAGEIIRYFILSSHYRSPLNYSDENLDSAKVALDRLYTALRDVSAPTADIIEEEDDYVQRFRAAMDDDFNTPEARAVLFDIARDLNRAKTDGKKDEESRLAGILKHLGATLGLLQDDPNKFLQGVTVTLTGVKATASAGTLSAQVQMSEEKIHDLIARRLDARRAKNWAESDRIRDELKAQGIILEDRSDGKTDWRRE